MPPQKPPKPFKHTLHPHNLPSSPTFHLFYLSSPPERNPFALFSKHHLVLDDITRSLFFFTIEISSSFLVLVSLVHLCSSYMFLLVGNWVWSRDLGAWCSCGDFFWLDGVFWKWFFSSVFLKDLVHFFARVFWVYVVSCLFLLIFFNPIKLNNFFSLDSSFILMWFLSDLLVRWSFLFALVEFFSLSLPCSSLINVYFFKVGDIVFLL